MPFSIFKSLYLTIIRRRNILFIDFESSVDIIELLNISIEYKKRLFFKSGEKYNFSISLPQRITILYEFIINL